MWKNFFVLSMSAIIASFLLLSCSGSGGGDENGESFPSESITMTVVFAAGGSTDLTARALAPQLEERLGQSVVVENRAGGSGTVGVNEMLSNEADGYNIAMSSTSPLVIAAQAEDVGFTLDDVTPIGLAVRIPSVLAVRDNASYESAEEFFRAAEENPGELSVGTAGSRTPQGVELARLAEEYDVNVNQVPFDTNAEAQTALLGGNLDAVFAPATEPVLPRINSGEFRPLVVSPSERLDFLSEVPTFRELGYEELTNAESAYGLIAPQGTPQEVVNQIAEALEAALENPEVREQIGERYIPDEFVGPDEYSAFLEELSTTYEPIVTSSN